MNQLYRSTLLKAVAFILSAVFIGCGVSMVANNFVSEKGVYLFEDSYEESVDARTKLGDAYRDIETIFFEGSDVPVYMLNQIEKSGMEYYAWKGDAVYTNTVDIPKEMAYDTFLDSAVSAGARIYMYNGEWQCETFAAPHIYQSMMGYYRNYYYEDAYTSGSVYDPDSTDVETAAALEEPFVREEMVVCVRMPQAMLAQNQSQWEGLRDNAYQAVTGILAMAFLSLGLFVYLCWVAGKKRGDEEIHLLLIDRAFQEITLGALLAAGGFGIFGVGIMIYYIYEGIEFAGVFSILAPVTAACVVMVVAACALSMIRNMKAHKFLERSFTVRIIRFLWRFVKRIIRRLRIWLRRIWRRLKKLKKEASMVFFKRFSQRKTAALCMIYLAATAVLALLTGALLYEGDGISAFLLLLLAVMVLAGGWFVFRRIAGFEFLKEGVHAIRNGNVDHKIEGCPEGALAQMAEDVNQIGEGLQESLKKAIKAERMKSELITNVSHDLKTPLTSIINYADLLVKEDLKPEEANDYAAIILQKGKRLKNLTADLFDISKVQSGNEVIQMERLDVVLLLNQSLAEFNSALENASFTLVKKLPKEEIFIQADGRKLSRVFENLFNNCMKYTMPQTRVYLNVWKEEADVVIELKNIASYAMEFDGERITERFVRGDSARSTEGSGLGLAIAKSYVSACGGNLQVIVDGDLFKVVIRFQRIE